MINIVITMGRAYILISHDLHHCLLSLFCLKHFRGGGRRGGKGEEEEWVRRGFVQKTLIIIQFGTKSSLKIKLLWFKKVFSPWWSRLNYTLVERPRRVLARGGNGHSSPLKRQKFDEKTFVTSKKISLPSLA